MDVDDESEDDMALDEDDDDESEEEDEEESGEDVEEYGEDTTVKLRDEDSSPGLPLWKGPRHPLLDDGFFSIDKFNRDTELLEAKSKSGGRLGRKSDDSDDSDEELEEEIDLFAPVENEDSEDEVEDASSDDEAQDDDDDGLAHAEDDDSDDEDDEDYANVSDQRITGALKTEGIESELSDASMPDGILIAFRHNVLGFLPETIPLRGRPAEPALIVVFTEGERQSESSSAFLRGGSREEDQGSGQEQETR